MNITADIDESQEDSDWCKEQKELEELYGYNPDEPWWNR